MSNKYHRQPFVAGKIVKAFSKKDAAKKAAEKIKKILKIDTAKFGAKFKKMTNIKKMLNKPAVDEYNKKVKEIKSRVTKGESREDRKDLQSAADKLNSKLFKDAKSFAKKYEGLPDIRSRFRPEPGPKRKLVKGVKNPFRRAEILQKERVKRFKKLGLDEGKVKVPKNRKFRD
jgi:preprotein translocase subunit Sss1